MNNSTIGPLQDFSLADLKSSSLLWTRNDSTGEYSTPSISPDICKLVRGQAHRKSLWVLYYLGSKTVLRKLPETWTISTGDQSPTNPVFRPINTLLDKVIELGNPGYKQALIGTGLVVISVSLLLSALYGSYKAENVSRNLVEYKIKADAVEMQYRHGWVFDYEKVNIISSDKIWVFDCKYLPENVSGQEALEALSAEGSITIWTESDSDEVVQWSTSSMMFDKGNYLAWHHNRPMKIFIYCLIGLAVGIYALVYSQQNYKTLTRILQRKTIKTSR